MVFIPPHLKNKILRMKLELNWLQLKERFFGTLSEGDARRKAELIRQLSVKILKLQDTELNMLPGLGEHQTGSLI